MLLSADHFCIKKREDNDPIAGEADDVCSISMPSVKDTLVNEIGGFYTRYRQETNICKVALSDGASRTIHSGKWAQILTEAFVGLESTSITEDGSDWLQNLQQQWWNKVFLLEQEPLPWYRKEGLKKGASATFLGVVIKDYRYRVLALGDSCFFHIRGDEVLSYFPKLHPDDFLLRPLTLSSVSMDHNNYIYKALKSEPEKYLYTNDCIPGDVLLLMTDALSHAFLQKIFQLKTRKHYFIKYFSTFSAEDSGKTESFWRYRRIALARHLLQNDDLTYIRISVIG